MTILPHFSRNIGSISPAEQDTLGISQIAVIGCGGLGGYVIELLARAGVGLLHVFDPDVFTESNCNRQLYALCETLGRNKAEVAAQRVRSIYPGADAVAYPVDFRLSAEFPKLDCQVVVDCLDDVAARRDLARICAIKQVPLVHGAVNGWCGQVGVQLPGHDLLTHLYPEQARAQETPSVLASTVACVASIQACETIKLLLKHSSNLHRGWLYIDLQHGDFLINELA